MRRTEALQGVRMAMFLNILHRWEAAELNQAEAAELLEVGERTFRRWRDRYDEEGEAGLLDRRLGKASGKRVPADRAEEVEALYRQRYQGFTVKHFHEHLVKDHGFGWSYTWTKLHLQWAGLVAKAPRKGAHRRKRERRPLPGDDAASGRLAPRMARGEAGARSHCDHDVRVGGIADDLAPRRKRELGGDDRRSAAITLFEDFEQIVTGAGVERLEAEVVENEEIGAAEGFDQARMAPVASGERHVLAE
jgi:transposase